MKTKAKTKTIPLKKTNKKSKSTKKTVEYIQLGFLGARHLKLVKHEHTGKLIHHRHTSHLLLMLMLSAVGFFLAVSNNIVQANESGTVYVSLIVPGPAPTIGATIVKPIGGSIYEGQTVIEVSGICAPNTFVVIKNNSTLAGSTDCTDAGIFILQAQLLLGQNTFSALNYDNLNQPGPKTESVMVELKKSATQVVVNEVSVPVLPSNPAVIKGIDVDPTSSGCNSFKADNVTTGGNPHIAIVCIPQLFFPRLEQVMGILVWGGSPPYAVNISWGNNVNNTLISIPKAGYVTEKFSYTSAGSHKIILNLIDSAKQTAIVQTAVRVNGSGATPVPITASTIAKSISTLSIIESSVPFYLIAVAITLGFWGGDIFERLFTNSKRGKKFRRAS